MPAPISTASIFKSLKIIHMALVIGLVVFGIFVYQDKGEFIAEFDQSNPFTFIVPIVAIIGYFASLYLFRLRTSKIERSQNLKEKLTAYQSASITKYACIEAPALFGFISYFLSGGALFLVIALCMTAYLMVQRPTIPKLKEQIPLTPEEIRELEN
ncbi:hypothetical protein [Cytophaga sp. FL35]|uniref:hypothetical protein n=1 Tax=Cytophaga sp. FL35 TaxID=1904456 RepID=UPI001653D896|nr:hypothetical protein [Cytophaga sp. FL35]MBC6998798.1 hypothetical protein [Cytophaga sp. FL35]